MGNDIVSAIRMYEKQIGELMCMYALKKGGLHIKDAPEVGDIVLYFKDNRLIFSVTVESVTPSFTVIVLDEVASNLFGSPQTSIKEINWIEHDFIICAEKITDKFNVCAKEFFAIFQIDDQNDSLQYWNDIEFLENLKKHKINILEVRDGQIH